MFKTFITLARGKSYESVERVADANALTILDQQIRDATGNLDRARRALAIAMAQHDDETRRIETVRARVVDLETRTIAALTAGRDDLATEAAEAIANLETDLLSATAAQASFARECAKLRAMTADAERRLMELERGRRTARASEAVRRLRSQGEDHLGGGKSALQDAEATLKRLRQRQLEDEVVSEALADAEIRDGVDLISDKLNAAGFGDTTKPNARSVLERLRKAQQTIA